MLKNIENFDGWLEINSYEDITIGKGEITLHVNSLKLMMRYMPIVQDLDREINQINSFYNFMIYRMSCGRNNIYTIDYEKNMKTLEEDMDRFYKKIDDNDLEVVSYTLNVSYKNYINDIVLKLKEQNK